MALHTNLTLLLFVFVAGCDGTGHRFLQNAGELFDTVVMVIAVCTGSFALLFLAATLYALVKNLRRPSRSSVITGKLTGGLHACIGLLMAISALSTVGDPGPRRSDPEPVEMIEYVDAQGRPLPAQPAASVAEPSSDPAAVLMGVMLGMTALGTLWFCAGVGLVVIASRAGKKMKLGVPQ